MEISCHSLLLSSLTLPLLLALFLLLSNRKRSTVKLPPGPRPWPILGNLPHLLSLLMKPQPLHAALASISRTHATDFLHLRLGTQSFVIASSPAAASEILKTHDRSLSTRSVPSSYGVPTYSDESFVWTVKCDHRWKSTRSLCRAELFSSGSLERGASTREVKVEEMMELLRRRRGREVNVGEMVFELVFDMLSQTVISRDLMGSDDGILEKMGLDMKKDLKRGLELGSAPNLEDFFPGLLGGWDVQGLRTEVSSIIRRAYDLWGYIIQERKEQKQRKDGKVDFLDVLLRFGLDGFQLKALLLDLFTAGTDTTTTSIEWAMSELIKNPEAMKRLKGELQLEGQQLQESRLLHLPYLQACIKESLRLHPPTPLLLPRRALEACEVMGYVVPGGSVVMVNAWAIGRDPEVWEDPLMFKPERFMTESGRKDFKGNDMELIPFGSGRRACPGLTLGTRMLSLVVACLVRSFDWSLPNGADARDLSMDEKMSIVSARKNPLVLIPH